MLATPERSSTVFARIGTWQGSPEEPKRWIVRARAGQAERYEVVDSLMM